MKEEVILHKENLLKLASYLELPELKAEFDMGRFTSTTYFKGESKVSCGSAGCAVGHGPYAGIPKTKKESWLTYSQRVFISDYDGDEWEWCFSLEWQGIDNTALGAAKRIRYLLKNGLPKNFDQDFIDEDDLCY